MKRKILLIAAIAATIILSSCGMKVEEIDPALTNLTSAYQGGAYEQAETLVKDLKKAYRKMSDEQKSKFDELKSEVEYAISTVDEIYNDFNDAQDLYDKKCIMNQVKHLINCQRIIHCRRRNRKSMMKRKLMLTRQ